MLKSGQNVRCYMCNTNATTKEHVPPYSFFPNGYRQNLITVPSCDKHNLNNSQDVEYVRNILVNPIQTNSVARKHFETKVLRSYQRSPKLFNYTFKEIEPIIFNGQQTALFTIDLERFESIMIAISYAIYFYHFDKKYFGGWNIICPQLTTKDALIKGIPDGYETIRSMFSRMSFKELAMPQPDVFGCGIYIETPDKIIFEFKFYGGLLVYAASIPFYYRDLSKSVSSDIPSS